jgi:hypothetical protein
MVGVPGSLLDEGNLETMRHYNPISIPLLRRYQLFPTYINQMACSNLNRIVTILIQAVCIFPQSLQANAWILLAVGHDHFLTYPFQ